MRISDWSSDVCSSDLLLAEMEEDVAEIVLEDNRLQTLAISIAERGGAGAIPPLVRAIEILEEQGVLNRAVEGLGRHEELMRRGKERGGPTRAELAGRVAVRRGLGGERGGKGGENL